jgi:glycosyltransferase involved in cell wall biosynthesis
MNSNSPLVSVIVAAYNAETFIKQTLDSVLNQTYRNIEVLVVDDGSEDRTAEIVAAIVQKSQRVILLQQSNQGVASARNLAIQNSRGAYIAPIDADDIWYPQKLEKQMQCMLQAEPSVGLVYAWSAYINEKDLFIGRYTAENFYTVEGDVYITMVYRNFIGNASTPLIRRACLDKIGGYSSQLKEQDAQGYEDWDLYLRIAEYYQFRVVPEFLVGYRQSTGSMSSNFASMARSYHLVIVNVQQKHPEIPSFIYQWSGSFFYNYLLGKSYECRDYGSTLVYIYRALQLDLALLLRLGLYKMFIKSLLKVAFKPVTSIWQARYPWLKLRQLSKGNNKVITFSEINEQVNQKNRFLWKPYDIILSQRWSCVVKMNSQSRELSNESFLDSKVTNY